MATNGEGTTQGFSELPSGLPRHARNFVEGSTSAIMAIARCVYLMRSLHPLTNCS